MLTDPRLFLLTSSDCRSRHFRSRVLLDVLLRALIFMAALLPPSALRLLPAHIIIRTHMVTHTPIHPRDLSVATTPIRLAIEKVGHGGGSKNRSTPWRTFN